MAEAAAILGIFNEHLCGPFPYNVLLNLHKIVVPAFILEKNPSFGLPKVTQQDGSLSVLTFFR